MKPQCLIFSIFLLSLFGAESFAQTCIADGGTGICTSAIQLPPRFGPAGYTFNECAPVPPDPPPPYYGFEAYFSTEGEAADFVHSSLTCNRIDLCDAGIVFPVNPFVECMDHAANGFNAVHMCRSISQPGRLPKTAAISIAAFEPVIVLLMLLPA
jgi:hypothetical protein